MSVASARSLEYLRSLIRDVEKPVPRERQVFSLLPAGLARGALVEITGAGKTEAVVQFLMENEKLRVAWVEDQLTVYPSAILQRHVMLGRILFIEAGQELPWALLQVLRSQLFECVVVSLSASLPEKILRRLQLEVERSHTFFFFLAEQPSRAWPVSVRLQAVRNQSLQLRVLKEKS